MSATKTTIDQGAISKALDVLKTFNFSGSYDWGKWGSDQDPLKAIEDAVPAVLGDPATAQELEKQLAAVLTTDAPLGAKDFVIRQLVIIASPQSLPILAALLPEKELSHRARMVIERMASDEAGQTLREALPKVSGNLKAGVIGSLGNRRDTASVAALGELVSDSDTAVALAAATALGDIGTVDAAHALESSAGKAAEAVKPRVGDAMLACAERLIRDDNKSAALAVYKSLDGVDLPKAVKTAAKRGKLMAM